MSQSNGLKIRSIHDIPRFSLTLPAFNIPKAWNKHIVQTEIEELETWAHFIGANLVIRNSAMVEFKEVKKRTKIIWMLNTFLWLFAFKTLLVQVIIDDDASGLLIKFGDLTNFYGSWINRLYFNEFIGCWAFHAASMYSIITRKNGRAREWLINFEECWSKTGYRAQRSENKSFEISKSRAVCSKLIKINVLFHVFLMTLINGVALSRNYEKFKERLYLLLFIIWSLVAIAWTVISTIINVTSMFHHYILCRAIISRFQETMEDMDTQIRNTRTISDPWIISRLLHKHYNVCDMVLEGNRYLKNYLFSFYGLFVPMICFFIYQIFVSVAFVGVKLILGLFVFKISLMIVFVSLTSAKITTVAHKPYHIVHGVGRMSLPEDVQLQATLFLQRLSGNSIGLTILDTFVITGGVISSIVTAIITYFSIIVEMN